MKTNIDKFFKTDADLEKNGQWHWLVEDVQGFLIRPFKSSNPRVKAAMAAHYKPHARQVELGTMDPVKEREISIKLFIQVCLVDWKGIEIDGEMAPCTKENALELFKELPDCFDTIWKYANDWTNFKEELGNS